jgi:hypothetical protein
MIKSRPSKARRPISNRVKDAGADPVVLIRVTTRNDAVIMRD